MKSYKDLSFKMDTLHDFLGNRVKNKIDIIYDILWDDIDIKKDIAIEKAKNVSKIKNFEKVYFYWLLKKYSDETIKIDNKPIITFSTSVENFTKCLSIKNKKIFFNIDASNDQIKNFKNIIISNLIDIDKLDKYSLEFLNSSKVNLLELYKKYNNLYNEIFVNSPLDGTQTKDIVKSNKNYIIDNINKIIDNYKDININFDTEKKDMPIDE